MILKRLRLKNYRGIGSCDVEFAETGLTLVEGPNEAGKSCLAEALQLLLDKPDNANSRQVKAVQPAGRDEGPEIEAELVLSGRTLVYRKRYLKRPITELLVSRGGKQENLSGRAAHDAVEGMLKDEIDQDLWRALNVEQGRSTEAPDFQKQFSLNKALDRAAGGSGHDPQSDTLFERASAEYEKYYAPKTRKEKKEISDATAAVEQAIQRVAALEEEIAAIEADVDRHAMLGRRVDDLEKARAELRDQAEKAREAASRIDALEHEAESLRAKGKLALNEAERLGKMLEARKAIQEEIRLVSEKLAELEQGAKKQAERAAGVMSTKAEAEAAAREAETAEQEAEQAASLRQKDAEYLHKVLDLSTMSERLQRVDDARAKAAAAGAFLESAKVDRAALDAIEKADKAFLLATAQFEAGLPTVAIKALRNLDINIGEESCALEQGAALEKPVRGRLSIEVPGAVEIEVRSGTEAVDLEKEMESKKEALRKKCRQFGVEGLEDARKAFEKRTAAEAALAELKKVETADLRDITREELERKVVGLRKHLPEYVASRPPEPEMAKDLREAERLRDAAREEHDARRKATTAARKKLDAIRSEKENVEGDNLRAQVDLDARRRDLKRLQDQLESSRKEKPDDELARDAEKARASADAAMKVATEKEASLALQNPEQVKKRAQIAKASLDRAENELRETANELSQTRGRLDAKGEKGLHEALNEARSAAKGLKRGYDSLLCRASAAKKLFDALSEARDRARKNYVAPFEQSINRLGALLYGNTFRVGLDDELRIESRSLNGVTLPFDSLSAGAREQLSVIAKLACGVMVAADSGVPIILDDALGFTDPSRLRDMGVVLAEAGRTCQLILMTCVPERFRNVGDARVVRVGDPAPGTG